MNAFAAAAGAAGLVSGWLSLTRPLERRLPLHSPVLGGVALAVFVAVPFTVLAWLAWRGDVRTATASVAMGLVLIGWILVQLAFLRTLSFFHPFYGALGVGLVVAGLRSEASNGS